MIYVIAIAFAALLGYWRYTDGSDNRWPQSSAIGSAIVFGAGVAGYTNCGNYLVFDPVRAGVIGIATLLVLWLVRRGMPGWTHYWPNPNGVGMLAGFALPTLALGGALYVLTGDLSVLPFALSGLLISAVYLEGSRLLPGGKRVAGLSAEQFGRLSYGGLAFGLVLLE